MPIKIQVASSDPLSTAVDVLVLGVSEGSPSGEGVLAKLQESLGEAVPKQLKRDDFSGKKDQGVEFTTYERVKPARVLVVGLGKGPHSDVDVRLLAAKGARFASTARAQSIAVVVPEGIAGGEQAAAEGLVLGSYRFTRYLTGDRLPKSSLERGTVLVQGKVNKGGRDAVALGQQVGESICIARDLINEPPNELYPEALAKVAVSVGKERGLKVTVLDKAALTKRGMKLILAVGQGSARDPRLIHMVYTPKGKPKAKLVFVGKGLTFDSGGLCIKPAPGMEEMKGDMGGAANVIGLMAAVAAMKPAVEVHGIIGSAENMPDGAAYRPGDIFGSLDGKTVEIINTDAEGRLVLADCLAYARQLKPDFILDNATLTGACMVALGPTVSGFFSNREDLAERVKTATRASGEAMWHMPLVEDLREGLKSEWADLKHTADRWGGAITAALFLREFVGDTPWIHVDVAGPSMAHKAYGIYSKGGTGHGVLTFLRLVDGYAR
ncbi:leucyl aminopeptidase [Chondromyces apiculatus]|uniref:Probable cytosol aminopeptidase n=1 Tax=Chondromyces apiculatus DSM 436 TaxID=1192034 RepID=A0A017STF1_9BACT|nr:leucyl aminopeptidase [Chondromyces apiculatus]EYF00283.1 Cytosol aminopeptidase PepA [Chondromyces apiculatus DSM 436]